MRLAVPKETREGETRVAATPESVKKFKTLGLEVVVQSGAGRGAKLSDAEYSAAGATIAPDAASALQDADIVLKVRGPSGAEISQFRSGAVLAALLAPHAEAEAIQGLAGQGVTAFAMELLPRISRAQSMDVLSSQANLAGYKAVIDAAAQFGRAMPMMMTAAGTIAPARVLVMGVGVAGAPTPAPPQRPGGSVPAPPPRPAPTGTEGTVGGAFLSAVDAEVNKSPSPR